MKIAGAVSGILAHKGSTVWSIAPDATVFDAIKLMTAKDVGALPVLESDQLVGLVSERDYTRKVILKGKSSKETAVAEIMTTDLVRVAPSDQLVDCMEIMTERRTRHLPVIEHGRLVGILSIGDVVKWLISAQAATIANLEEYTFGAKLD